MTTPFPAENPSGEEVPMGAKPRHQWPWAVTLAVLALVTVVNLGWAFREPLLGKPEIRAFAEAAGIVEMVKPRAFRDTTQIQLVSRDIHSHPTRAGILVLSATLVNLAPKRQALPEIEISLTNSGGRMVASRRFTATEYLPPGADLKNGLESDAYLPVLLEFADPGKEAVGFELSFY
jgi:hypothetical protein